MWFRNSLMERHRASHPPDIPLAHQPKSSPTFEVYGGFITEAWQGFKLQTCSPHKDRGAWQATVHGVTRVGQDLATKWQPPSPLPEKGDQGGIPSRLTWQQSPSAPTPLKSQSHFINVTIGAFVIFHHLGISCGFQSSEPKIRIGTRTHHVEFLLQIATLHPSMTKKQNTSYGES